MSIPPFRSTFDETCFDNSAAARSSLGVTPDLPDGGVGQKLDGCAREVRPAAVGGDSLITVGMLYRPTNRSREPAPSAWRREPLPRLPWKPFDCRGFGLVSCLEIFRDSWACCLLNQFAAGPSLKSDIAGWAYHFWNGASFGLIYVLVFGTCRRWVGTVFGVLLGFGFMFSPVVSALGVGFLGLEFSQGIPRDGHSCPRRFRSGSLGLVDSKVAGIRDEPLLEAVEVCSCEHGHKRDSAPAGSLKSSAVTVLVSGIVVMGRCYDAANGREDRREKTTEPAADPANPGGRDVISFMS